MAPNKVTEENRDKIYEKLYGSKQLPPVCRISVGDKVRIPMTKNIFMKGYDANWSKELYTVTHVFNDGFVCYYSLKTSEGDGLKRKFYTQELNLVSRNALPEPEQ